MPGSVLKHAGIVKFYTYNFMKKYRLYFTTATFQPEKGSSRNTEGAILVGAGLLAMDSSAPRLTRPHALSLTIIASKPAPTRGRAHAVNEATSNPVKAPKKIPPRKPGGIFSCRWRLQDNAQ
jgi:hypothetical protein